MSIHRFCRDICLEAGEPLGGTGDLAERVMLVGWPRAKWRVPRYESRDMGTQLCAAIRAAMDAGVHVALVDQPGRAEPMLWMQADGLVGRYQGQDHLAKAILRVVAGEQIEGAVDRRPAILCCTDSRRDACCARYGFETFKALHQAVDPLEFQLFQCTHLGGCRFSASLVVLPQRARYGRLEPEHVPMFLQALRADSIYLPAFRGRTGLTEIAQQIERAGLMWAKENNLDGAFVTGANHWAEADEPTMGREIKRDITVGTIQLRVTLERLEILAPTRCDTTAGDEQPRMRWHVQSVQRLD